MSIRSRALGRARSRHGVAITAVVLITSAAATALASAAGTTGATTTPACPASPPAAEKPWLNTSFTAACRARYAVNQLTTDEKIQSLGSAPSSLVGGLSPTLLAMGFPQLQSSDGPAGVQKKGTAFPAEISSGAAFDPKLAAERGTALGQEFNSFGDNVMLAPTGDIARGWQFGRGPESFGEDPFLTGSLLAPVVKGAQSEHVIAMLKHYAAYTQEQGRLGASPSLTGEYPAFNHGPDSSISKRTLQEVYMPAFGKAIKEGGAGSVMCGHPRINGKYVCDNSYLLSALKTQFGFTGFVGPDQGSQRSTAVAANAGLDTGNWGPDGKVLKDAVDYDRISEARIDQMLVSQLTSIIASGLVENPVGTAKVDKAAHQKLATQIATDGAVLLKNSHKGLPIKGSQSVAVIGPQGGDKPAPNAMGSSEVTPQGNVPAITAITGRSKGKVTYSQGTESIQALPVLDGSSFTTPSGQPGLKGTYYASTVPKGNVIATRVDKNVDFKYADFQAMGLPKDNMWSVRWEGNFLAKAAGNYKFSLDAGSTAQVYVNDKLITQIQRADFSTTTQGVIRLKAGSSNKIRVDYSPFASFQLDPITLSDQGLKIGTGIQLGGASPSQLINDAVKAAKKADVAVVYAGELQGEGADRTTLTLPGDQNELISKVAAANKHTVVVLTTGGGVAMPWLNDVESVLELWYPGDGMGTASASLLYGDTGPGGRLPVTFPRNSKQGATGRGAKQYPGLTDSGGTSPFEQLAKNSFSENSNVGYKYYDARNQKPLFPFGFGLSYTSFSMKSGGPSKHKDGSVTVKVKVRNTGSRRGSTVVQGYVGSPRSVGAPKRQLKAFEKVAISAGKSKTVTLTFAKDAFAHWDSKANGWRQTKGRYTLYIGKSSRSFAGRCSVSLKSKSLGK